MLSQIEVFDIHSVSSQKSPRSFSWSSTVCGSPRFEPINNHEMNSYQQDKQEQLQVTSLLKQYILLRCSESEHCEKDDFDHTALEALIKMPFIQALQTVEHYSTSVSKRIQKKSAYLMGILNGQQNHWNKVMYSNLNYKRGNDLLNLSSKVLIYIGQCCLKGNCLPSDFTPEVCLRLHNLTPPLAIKAAGAFNSNKRIIAGPKGGVINRSRFFLRLIQNIAEQTPSAAVTVASGCSVYSGSDNGDLGNVHVQQLKPRRGQSEISLEQLANIDLNGSSENQRIKQLEEELTRREHRERALISQMCTLETTVQLLKQECGNLKTMLALKQEETTDLFNYSYGFQSNFE